MTDSLDIRFFGNTFVSAWVWELTIYIFKISREYSKNKNQDRCFQHFLFLNSEGKFHISKNFSNLSHSLQDNKNREKFKCLKITWWPSCILWVFTERENAFFMLTLEMDFQENAQNTLNFIWLLILRIT